MDPVMMRFFYVLSGLTMAAMSFGYMSVGLSCDRKADVAALEAEATYWLKLGLRALKGLGDIPQTTEGICVAALNGLDRLRQAEQEASEEVIRTVTGPAKTEDEIEELRRRQ